MSFDVITVESERNVSSEGNDVSVAEVEGESQVGVSSSDSLIIETAALETVIAGEPIVSKSATIIIGEEAFRANNLLLTQRHLFLGLAMTAGNTGDEIIVKREGIVDEPSWSWTQGAPLYLNGTSISETPPTSGLFIILGGAQTPTSILLNPTDPIELS